MIKTLIFAVVFGVLTILGISFLLQPDDLGKCGEKPSQVSGCQSVDAIVAVSGGDTKARASEAIRLFKNGWSDKLIFSGAALDKSGPSNASVMRDFAIAAGVSLDKIYLDEYSETTQQNAQNVQTIFAKHDIDRVILITSGYHQRRAGLEFKKRTTNVTIINHPAQSDSGWSFWWWLTPYGWWLAISEVVKIMIFYVTGIWS